MNYVALSWTVLLVGDMNQIRKMANAYRHFRAGGFQAAKRFLRELDHNHAHVLSINPPIVYLWWGRDDSILHQCLADSDLTVLYLFPWCYSTTELTRVQAYVQTIHNRFPRHQIIFLCNEEYAVEELRAANLKAEFIHQNAFIDEQAFAPRPLVIRTHDAVYSASLAPYKRHSLAAKIQSLIIMSYTYGGTTSDAYSVSVREELKHAWWAKDSLRSDQKFSVEQIVDLYARAHVGLCLSAVEGGMFVSMEYLLCGLPIVSTESVGGRDVFWDDRYVIVCDDTPEAVEEAVTELRNRNIAPQDVRRWTLEKVMTHRNRLRLLMESLGAELNCPWPPGTHGISTYTNLKKLGYNLREQSLS
ncbi:MAG: glycosyltransferase [Prochlorococcaceae cyanobacterium]